MSKVKCGDYHWIRLAGSDEDDIRTWEPAYRFRGSRGVNVWLVIATNEDIPDDRIAEIGPRLEPPK